MEWRIDVNKRKLRKFRRKVLLFFVLIILFTSVGLYSFSIWVRPKIILLTQSYAKNEISQTIDVEVKKVMLEEFFSYDKIVTITRDSENRVNSVSSDTTLINRFTNDLGIAIGDELDKKSQIKHKIPISNLFGIELFAGLGPSIPVRFYPVSVTNADITHSFEEAGINQTIHTINLTVSVDMAIMVPLAQSVVKTTSTMPIAQTLIVGTVPDAYIKR